MTKVNRSTPHPNLQLIRTIKTALSDVSATDVAVRLGYSRQNLYKHLNEDRADKANTEELVRISDAIAKEKAAAQDLLNKATTVINKKLKPV
jgi:hypothetical protein